MSDGSSSPCSARIAIASSVFWRTAVSDVPLSTQNVVASTQKWAARREIQDATVSLEGGCASIVSRFSEAYSQICQRKANANGRHLPRHFFVSSPECDPIHENRPIRARRPATNRGVQLRQTGLSRPPAAFLTVQGRQRAGSGRGSQKNFTAWCLPSAIGMLSANTSLGPHLVPEMTLCVRAEPNAGQSLASVGRRFYFTDQATRAVTKSNK